MYKKLKEIIKFNIKYSFIILILEIFTMFNLILFFLCQHFSFYYYLSAYLLYLKYLIFCFISFIFQQQFIFPYFVLKLLFFSFLAIFHNLNFQKFIIHFIFSILISIFIIFLNPLFLFLIRLVCFILFLILIF